MVRLFFHPASILIITLVAGLFLFSLRATWQKARLSTETVQSLEANNAQLADQLIQLQHQLDQAETPFAKEKIIRDQLLLQQPGETVLQVAYPTEREHTPSGNTHSDTPWDAWKLLLLGD